MKRGTEKTEKMDKPARIHIVEDVSLRATVAAVLKKNGYAANFAANLPEAAKQTGDTSLNSTLKDGHLPDIESISRSLQKVQEITAAVHLLWPNKKTATKIITNSVEIINQACKRKFSFCNGKSLKCIVGGLFYLLGFRYDDSKKQIEIAVALEITDVTIRSSYKRWLKEFPDLFQDVIAKLADQELRHHCHPNAARPQSQTALIGSRKCEDELKNQSLLKPFDQILLEDIDEALLSLSEKAKISIYTRLKTGVFDE
jgi:hypothetical protein